MPTNIFGERMVKSFLDVIVLAQLSRDPQHGYALVQQIRNNTGVLIGAGVMYPLLYELEDKGLIKGEWTSPERRTRRVYAITQSGRSLLAEAFESIERILAQFRSPIALAKRLK
jgi:PadR family transcriptional regulator